MLPSPLSLLLFLLLPLWCHPRRGPAVLLIQPQKRVHHASRICDGWMVELDPDQQAVGWAFAFLLKPRPHTTASPGTCHFDRSCSQLYCEERSGEIRFSTSTSSYPQHTCFCLQKPGHSECSQNPPVCCPFRSQNYFSAFSAQKSHVKPQNHLNASKKRK
jgi:hypothetical protein